MSINVIAGAAIAKTFEWIWKNLGKDIVKLSTKTSIEQIENLWQKFTFNRAAQNYTKEMKSLYGKMQIWRMEKPLPLEQIFTHVNVLDKPSIFRRTPEEQLKKIYLGETTYGDILKGGREGLDVLRENHRLFILGKPGAGKTTFLKYIVLAAIGDKIDKKLTQIPIFISLKRFSESKLSLFKFIVHQFEICNFPDAGPFIEIILKRRGNFKFREQLFAELQEKKLSKKDLNKLSKTVNKEFTTREELLANVNGLLGDSSIVEENKSLFLKYTQNDKWNAIILCDGLDEVPQENDERQRVINELIDFSNQYEQSQFVITCRIAASEYHFNGFTYVEIADFEKKQIENFISNWFIEQPQFGQNFLGELDKIGNERLQDLAKTPLILTLLCIAYKETLEIAARRSEIYKDALNALLIKWSTSRGIKRDEIYRQLSLGRKEQMFARIAAETFQNNEYLIDQEKLEKKISNYLQKLPQADLKQEPDETRILKAIEAQHGIFVERAQGIYSFSHLTFQEYYTARYIWEHLREGTPENLIQNYFANDNWREVFLLTAEMLDDADEFFEMFISVLDSVIIPNARLISILQIAERESNKIKSSSKPFQKRCAILYLMLNASWSTAFAIGKVEIDSLTKVSNRSSASARAIDTTIANAREIDRARTRAYDTAIIDYKMLLQLSEKEPQTEFRQSLLHLKMPTEESSLWDWEVFTRDLQGLMHSNPYVKRFVFTGEEAWTINQYLKGTKVLLDCLEIAYVSDRVAIENCLIRPPK